MAIGGALKEEGRKEKALTWGPGLSAGASRGALGSGTEGVGPRRERAGSGNAGGQPAQQKEGERGPTGLLGWAGVFYFLFFFFSKHTQTNLNSNQI